MYGHLPGRIGGVGDAGAGGGDDVRDAASQIASRAPDPSTPPPRARRACTGVHDPTHLVATSEGYLAVFGSGQGVCGESIVIKYMAPGSNEWVQKAPLLDGCGAELSPSFLQLLGFTSLYFRRRGVMRASSGVGQVAVYKGRPKQLRGLIQADWAGIIVPG